MIYITVIFQNLISNDFKCRAKWLKVLNYTEHEYECWWTEYNYQPTINRVQLWVYCWKGFRYGRLCWYSYGFNRKSTLASKKDKNQEKVSGTFLPTTSTIKFMSTDGETEYSSLTIGKVVNVKIDLGMDLTEDKFLSIQSCRKGLLLNQVFKKR